MAKSLQEQLLQSGAARPKQAKKARREKAETNKAARRQGQQRPSDEQALQQQVAAAAGAKRERDRQINVARNNRREAREREAAVAQIIDRNRVAAGAAGEAAVVYNYRIGKTIHRIDVSESQRRELADGRLAIVRHRHNPSEAYSASLLPRAVAKRLLDDIPKRIWLVTEGDEPMDPDDPYARFPVPDDLMW